MRALDVSLKRVCTCYWALAGTPRHSAIAPVDVLAALILQRAQLGGALQQDVGEVLQCLHLAPVTGLHLPADGPAVSVDGIVLAQLNMETLKRIPLPCRPCGIASPLGGRMRQHFQPALLSPSLRCTSCQTEDIGIHDWR